MSRIGKKPVIIPDGVQVEVNHKVTVRGKLGELSLALPKGIRVERGEGSLIVSRVDESRAARSLHGLTRSLIANMITGVSLGFKKTLELSGIGFRANLSGKTLVLSIGFSHPVEIEPPEGVNFAVADNKITVSGVDKELVGGVAAQIRSARPPDPYKGKGIRYEGERIRLRPGKAAKTSVGVGS